ncbi:DHA2 family efflux MFS transporter permease subunit [Anthocerotibacter panamensis]|uniref:DHA2 family efflux MFS transporter permease subunit n=1 Tax=Anthocerotibacter panamensis TaxID=2857077 RepID=UPI001C4075BE|nr:DHA2 family efflux MFS transporter permease subunit [Anthocerotibacter panamensis]
MATTVALKAPQISTEPQVSLRAWLSVAGVMLGAFMAILDIQITNSSLKDIQGALNATLEEGSWISTSYLVAEIIVIPLTGWLSKVFSNRLYLLVNTVLFIFFSVCCASAWDLNSMIVFRGLQGFSGGVLIPMAFTVMLTTLPPSKQTIGLALFGMTATLAPSIGPTIGGWLTENFGWEYIFYINVIPGALMLAALWFTMDPRPLQLNLLKKGDWWGILTMAIGLGSLQIVLEEGSRKDWFGSDLIARLAVVAVVFLALFLWIEFTRKEPFINLRLFAKGNFGLGSIVNVTLGLGLYGSVYILPLYLAQIQGYNALQIGQVIMWAGLPQFFIFPLLPRLMKRFDTRVLLLVGLALFSTSCFMNAGMTHDTGADQLIWSQIVRALGQPLIITPLSSLITIGVGKDAGSASGLFNMMRNLGGSMGIALLATLLDQREKFHSSTIGEAVSRYNPLTEERLDQLTQNFMRHGMDFYTAQNQAMAQLDRLVRREATVMAFNDCFFIIGVGLLLGGLVVLLMKKGTSPGAGAGH